MMRRTSRIVSVLLVLAMLCAMVPAVFAATNTIDTEETKVAYVGETISVPILSCGHITGIKFEYYTDKNCTTRATGSNYIIKADNYGNYKANTTTMSKNNAGNLIFPNGVVYVKVCCSQYNCKESVTFGMKIYSLATGIKVQQNGKSIATNTSVTLTKGDTLSYNVNVEPYTSLQEIETYEVGNEILDATISNGVLTITPKKDATGNETDLYLDAKGSAASTYKRFRLHVNVVDDTGITIKKDGKTVENGKSETVFVGSKFKMTASTVSTSQGSLKPEWSSSDTSVVYIDPETGAANAKASGKEPAVLTVRIGNASASYSIYVIDNVDSVKLQKEINGSKVDVTTDKISKDGSLKIFAATDPEGSESAASWTVSDENVLDLSGTEGYNDKTKTVSNAAFVTVKAKNEGKATLTATVGGKRASMTITVQGDTISIVGYADRGDYKIRDGSDFVARFQELYPTVPGMIEKKDPSDPSEEYKFAEVPVRWIYNDEPDDTSKTVKIYGRMLETDASGFVRFSYPKGVSRDVEAIAALTDDVDVKLTVKASAQKAAAGDKITATATATAEPSGCSLTYQWSVNGTVQKDAKSASFTYTIPASGASEYVISCMVTAKNGSSGKTGTRTESVTVSVARDYTVELSLDDNSSTNFTVGKTVKATATVYNTKNGGKTEERNASVTWQLLDSAGKEIKTSLYSITYSGSTASITVKAAGASDNQKVSLVASYRNSQDGVTYSGTKEVTFKTATAGAIKMSVGDGAAIKATTVQSKAKDAVKNSNASLSYVTFGTPKNCTLTKSSGSSSTIGSTKCYFSTSSGQKLSDVYVKLDKNAASGSVTYTVFDTNDNAVVTGTINFDGAAGEGSITCLGVAFDDVDVEDLIKEEFSGASDDVDYVKFDELASKYGRLLMGYKGIVEIKDAKDVKDSDKYYLNASKSEDGVEELYLLPRTDYYGTIKLDYTAYSSSNKSLGEGTLTFTVTRKTSSSKFNDVTSANVGSWAADAIDFMAGNGLVGGTGSGKFSPTGTMTRCDLVLIMYRMAGEPSVNDVTNPFTDVKAGDYFYKAVLWAYKNGVVTGTGANTFSPKRNITREQIASILYRYSGATTATGSLNGFTDAGKVSDYATAAMKWAVGAGIIGGSNNKLDPQGNATRAQVAVMLHRFLNK